MNEGNSARTGYQKTKDDRAVRTEITSLVRGEPLTVSIPHNLEVLFHDLHQERHQLLAEQHVERESQLSMRAFEQQLNHAFGTMMNSILGGFRAKQAQELIEKGVLEQTKNDFFNRIELSMEQAQNLVRMLIEQIIEHFKNIYPTEGHPKNSGFEIEAKLKAYWFDSEPIVSEFKGWDPFSQDERSKRMAKGIYNRDIDPRKT